MDVLETDYSNLFAAGLRGIQSRTTGRSCSEPQLGLASTGSADPDQDVKRPSIPSSFWKTFLLSTRLLRRPSRSPRSEKDSSAVRNPTASKGVGSKHTRPHSIPSEVGEEISLNLRILDWSVRVSNATAILDDEDECVDPYLFNKADSVDVPASSRTTILVTLPTSTSPGEQVTSPMPGQRDRRLSLQTLPMHMVLPALPYHSFFALDEETNWESDSTSSSDDESGLDDDDWHQFRVEWIDFDGAH